MFIVDDIHDVRLQDILQIYHNSFQGDERAPEEWWDDRFQELLQKIDSPWKIIGLDVSGVRSMACIKLSRSPEQFSYLAYLATAEGSRSLGFGTKVLQHTLDMSAELGAGGMIIDISCSDQGARILAWYEQLGAVLIPGAKLIQSNQPGIEEMRRLLLFPHHQLTLTEIVSNLLRTFDVASLVFGDYNRTA